MTKVPTITPGPDDTGHAPEGATETLPLITSAPTAQQNDNKQGNAGISDDEAYAKLKTKRAERRHKKLVRRGIAAGIVGGMILIAIIASVILTSQPQSADGPVTDMVMEGTFYHDRRGKRAAQAYFGLGRLPFCRRYGGTDQRAGRSKRQRGRRAHDDQKR